MATKRKLPGNIQSIAADHVIADAEEHPALKMAKEQDVCTTPPRVPKGSPADAFRQSQIIKSPKEEPGILTCDLSVVPKDKWNKRRTLSAVVLAVLPIKSKGSTVRRNVILRDECGECWITVWGNHTNIIDESAVGRPITLQRVCLTEFEGQIQISMPKDSSVSLGNTPNTAPIMIWLQRVGNTPQSVQQVRHAQITPQHFVMITP